MSAAESYTNNIEGVKQYQQKLQDDTLGGYDEMVSNLTSDYNDTLTKYQDKWSSLQDAGVDDLLGMAGSKALITGGYKLYKHINRFRKPQPVGYEKGVGGDVSQAPRVRPAGESDGGTSGSAVTEDASEGLEGAGYGGGDEDLDEGPTEGAFRDIDDIPEAGGGGEGGGEGGDDLGGGDVITPNQGAAGTELDPLEQITQDPLEFQDDAPVPNRGAAGTELDGPDLHEAADEPPDGAGYASDRPQFQNRGYNEEADTPSSVNFGDRGGQVQPASSDAPPLEQPKMKPPDIDSSYDTPEASKDLPSNFQGGGEMKEMKPVNELSGQPSQNVQDQLSQRADLTRTGGPPGGGGGDADGGGTSLFDDAKSFFGDVGFEDVVAGGEVLGAVAGLVMIGDSVYHLFDPPSKPKAPTAQNMIEPLQQTTSKYSDGLVSTDSAQDRSGSGAF